MPLNADTFAGVLLGTAVGDALGLPREGLSRRRARRLFGDPPLRHRFVLGRGMVSDDTEHTCLLAQALLDAPDDPERFARSLAWRLRLWLLGCPAGIGLATLRALLKSWVGFPPSRSGVFSAGNGPAMRAALLGVRFGGDPAKLLAFVRASTRLTHSDPRAEHGALLVALAAWHGAEAGPNAVDVESLLRTVRGVIAQPDAEFSTLVEKLEQHLGRNAPAAEFADALGLQRGVTGYVYHTVFVALYSWLLSPADFQRAVETVIALGGDTDTTGAIVGALGGATVGAGGIPFDWLGGIVEWPRSQVWMRRLAERLAAPMPMPPLPLYWPGLLVRNGVFLLLVFLHGFRRLLPPY
jgi:ADP-ribosyl-[dinitrogen reductase] hydrolase